MIKELRMQSLKHYLAESVKVHTYDFRLQIAGDVDENKMTLLTYNLNKFCPVSISEPKTTPIQKVLAAFPDVENERVTTIDIKCRYPITEPMVRQFAQLIGIDENRVRLLGANHEESIDAEMEGYSNQMKHSPVLTHEEMEEQSGAKAAAKAYGDSYLDSINEQSKDDKIDIPYEGKKTASAFDPFKPEAWIDSMGKKSPMTTITRPEKPKTGAMGAARY